MELIEGYIQEQKLNIKILAGKESVSEEIWNAVINDNEVIVIEHYKDDAVFAYGHKHELLCEKYGISADSDTLITLLEEEVMHHVSTYLTEKYQEVFTYENDIEENLPTIIQEGLLDMKKHVHADDLFGETFMDNVLISIEMPVLKFVALHMEKRAAEYLETVNGHSALSKLLLYK